MIGTARKLGGLRPTARFAGYALLAAMGFFRSARRVDWSRVQRLVFVCSGNICRSPYGEMLARTRGVRAISFGIHANGIAAADPTAVRVAQRLRVDLTGHISTRAVDYEPRPGDMLLAMEPVHLSAIRGLVGTADVQMTLLGLWGRWKLPYLPDPYGRSDECFDRVFAFVAAAVEGVIGRMRSRALAPGSSVRD
jgi:protein-tyrosine phosphatase